MHIPLLSHCSTEETSSLLASVGARYTLVASGLSFVYKCIDKPPLEG